MQNVNTIGVKTPYYPARATSKTSKPAAYAEVAEVQKAANTDTVTFDAAVAKAVSYTASAVKTTESVSTGYFMSSAEISKKLAELKEAVNNTDYKGMKREEVYADIQKRYENAFGDLLWIATGGDGGMISESWNDIGYQFYNTLYENKAWGVQI